MSLVTVQGGKTSHTGILARSLQIPAVVGVAELERSVRDGDLVIVDGLKGRILIDPDDEELAHYEELGEHRITSYNVCYTKLLRSGRRRCRRWRGCAVSYNFV